MKSKPLIGLVLVTAVVVAGAVAAVALRQSASRPAVVDEVVLPDLMDRINEVSRVTLTGPEFDIALQHNGAQWVVPALADFPADFNKVKKALVNIAELRAVEAKTANPERYHALGLAEPDAEKGGGTWVRLFAGGQQPVASVMVGAPGRSGAADQLYIRRDGELQTWLARGDLTVGNASANELGTTPIAWTDTLVAQVSSERVRRVLIEHKDGETVELARETSDEDAFDLVNMPEDASLRSPLTLENVANSLAYLRYDDVAPASAGPARGEGDSTATFQTFDGLTVTITLENRPDGEDSEATWARIDAEFDPAAAVQAEQDPAAEGEDTDADPLDPEEHLAELLARTEHWVFRIAEHKSRQYGMRMAGLVDLPTDDDTSETGTAPSQLIPGTMPPGILPPGVEAPPVIQLN